MKQASFQLFVRQLLASYGWIRSKSSRLNRGQIRQQGLKKTQICERLEDRTLLSTFSNNTSITIPDNIASPYPSQIQVSNIVSATILGVDVSLNGVSHTSPDDIDALLAGPDGTNVILMSDAGGSNSVSNANLNFSDAAVSQLSDAGQISSGTYQVSNFVGADGTDAWPSPAPVSPSVANTLSAFNGLNVAGTWSLYVNDDAAGSSGAIAGGWSLDFLLGGDVVIDAGDDADDGETDTFLVNVTSTNIQVTVNGTLVFDEPFAGITSLTINGSGDDDNITVTGEDAEMASRLAFNGAEGTNTLDVSDVNVQYSDGDGLYATLFNTTEVSSSTFSHNLANGINLETAGTVTVTDVTADDNGTLQEGTDGGLRIAGAATVTITGTSFSDNVQFGIQIGDVTGLVDVRDVTANYNGLLVDGDGIQLSNVDDVSISDSTINHNFRDGIHIESAGDVTLTTVIANFNGDSGSADSGVYIDTADSFTDVDGSFSNNVAHGIYLIDINGDVTLTRTAANDNDGNIDFVGDGLIALDGEDDDGFAISGNFTLNGGTFNDNSGSDSDETNQVNGINVSSVGGNVVLDASVDDITVTGNELTGVFFGPIGGTATFTDGEYSENGNDGIRLTGVVGLTTLTGPTVTGNGDQGVDLSEVGDVTAVGGTYSENATDGISIDSAGIISLTNVTANDNDTNDDADGDGVYIGGTGAVTITGGTFNGNGSDDGIELSGVGAVIISGIQANGNDPGLNISNAPSVSISNSSFQNNNNGGVVISAITGPVTLTNITATENDADGDDNGDGFNASGVTGPIVILGGTFSDLIDDNEVGQVNGIVITESAGVRVYIGNDGTTNSGVTASGNAADGISIDGVLVASLDTVTAADNGSYGFEITDSGAAILSDLSLSGNATGGGSLDGVSQVAYTTSKVATGAVDDQLQITSSAITRLSPLQQSISYVGTSSLAIYTGLGADTIDVDSTGASTQTLIYGGSGNDTIKIAGSSLNNGLGVYGDTYNELLPTNTIGGTVQTPVTTPGDDEVILNIVDDITASILIISGDGNATTRDRLTINNSGDVDELTFDWSPSGVVDLEVAGFAIDVGIATIETVQYNDTGSQGAADDTTVTLIGQTSDDKITVAPISATSAVAFNGGNPFEDTSGDSLVDSLPGYAGGGGEADLSFNGLVSHEGIFVDGNGATGPGGGDQLFVYGQTELGVIDGDLAASEYVIFSNLEFGPGQLIPTQDAGDAFDNIFTNNGFVAVNDFVEIEFNESDFAQDNPLLTSGLIINSGDEVAAGIPDPIAGLRADLITVYLSAVYPITVNGGLPGPTGVNSNGDRLDIRDSFKEVQVWSDKASPPNVTFNFIGYFENLMPLRESSIEAHGPIYAATVTLIGDNNNPEVDQTDNFVVVGQDVDSSIFEDADGANEFVLSINGSNNIPFTHVQYLNAYGDDIEGSGDSEPDTLEVTPYADYSNGGNPPSSPLGWGIDTYFNEGGDEGDQADLLIVNGVDGVSEVTTLTPSDEEDGQVSVTFADGTLISNINYVSNIGFIFNGNDGSAGDTDRLVLRGTDGVTPGTSGDETVQINYDNPGTAELPFITVADSAAAPGSLLYAIHNITNFDRVTLDLMAGNDSVFITDGAGPDGEGFANTIVDVELGAGNDIVDASASTTDRSYEFHGGDGSDTITGGAGDDDIYGDAGNDDLIGGDGDDLLDGGVGVDELTGGLGDDYILGGEDDDRVFIGANDGDDFVDGGAGADVLYLTTDGGSTAVRVPAGGSNGFEITTADINPSAYDVEELSIDGTEASNNITLDDLSGSGLEVISIGLSEVADQVTVNGRGTDDDIAVSTPIPGQLNVQGLPYEIFISTTTTADTLVVNGNDGNDKIKASPGVENIVGIIFNGGLGDDFLSADATLNGDAGNDTLVGGVGADILNGGEGDDTLTGNGGADAFNGGGGYDTIVETRNADFTLTDGSLSISGEVADTLNSIENAILTGGALGNTFSIGAFTGDTTVFGKGGSDLVSFENAPEAIRIDLDATGVSQIINLSGRAIVFGDVIENLTATEFNDTIEVDIAQYNRTIDGGSQSSIPPGDRLIVDMLGSNPETTKVANPPNLGSFNGTVNGASFTGTINYFDIETLVPQGANSTPPDFTAATQYSVGNGPRGVIAADVNGDGILDMIVANSLSNDITIRFGNGFGTFSAAMTYSAGGKKAKQTTTVAVGDFDGDDDLDIVVANRKTNNVSVLLNDGTGHFGAATLYDTGIKNTGKFPTSVKVGDMNGDDVLDIVTANSNVGKKGSVSILTGNGDGTFNAANVTQTLGRRPRDLVLIDVDSDNDLDVVATNLLSKNVVLLKNDGTGVLGAPANYAVGATPNSIVAGDFNNDGITDVAVTSLVTPEIGILLGNGDGFDSNLPVRFPGKKLDISINTADIDGDGNLDLLISNRNDNTLSYMLGNGNGTFDARVDFKVGNTIFREPVSIAFGDFNGDGAVDLMIANAGSDDVSVLLHDPIV